MSPEYISVESSSINAEEQDRDSLVIITAVHRMQETMFKKGFTRQKLLRQKLSQNNYGRSHVDEHSEDNDVSPKESQEILKSDADLDLDIQLGPLGAYLKRMKIRSHATQVSRNPENRWQSAPGLARFRLDLAEPQTLGSVIDDVVASRQWVPTLSIGAIVAQWSVIVGSSVAEHCHVETFEKSTLTVRCSSTAWAKQLTLLLPHIERRIAEEIGQGIVSQVLVRGPVSPSWKKGFFSVQGRGVRDTYG